MISYILEVSFSWLIFYLAYILLLQQEHFFGVNRGYLLITLITGLWLPFLQIETTYTYPIPQLSYFLEEITVGEQVAETVEYTNYWHWSSILLGIYGIGVFVGVVRFVLSLQKLHSMYKNGMAEHKSFYTLIKTNSIHSPFSFGSYLFISNNIALEKQAYQYVIEHETAHIRQKHTLDLLLVECLSILFWFNPLVFLYKTALRDQHEFLADQAVLSHVPIKEYGQLLIEQSIPGLKIGLVNHLIYSQLKKRINMMTKKKKSNRPPYFRYALSFSAFLLVFWTVSCSKDLPSEAEAEIAEKLSSEKLTASKYKPTESDKTSPLFVAEKMPRFPGCEHIAGNNKAKKTCADEKLLQFIYDNIKYPKKAKKDGTEGVAIVSFIVSETGTIKNPKILRSVSQECDAEVLRIIELMNENGLVWTPGEDGGKLVDVTYNLPIRFKLK
ncbi:M56 family metallopeptidase [Aureispira sp. CCB-E]|uniref:M56 family metallopeptidase n=1 Tax=Aureispira sp. CCB-E TaxID=3051121 RepID=UPI00286889B8|nr:M56 family metallopeptidase [Aureispira sp. CCB-E]WMX12481.1 M56 family metallopeptidase [Aureispira sp. CCB-E]